MARSPAIRRSIARGRLRLLDVHSPALLMLVSMIFHGIVEPLNFGEGDQSDKMYELTDISGSTSRSECDSEKTVQ